ncbi:MULTISPECIES: hypothetical protein [unclassified Microcoleus]|uniref:hypothetical protein n=1 Tax=unclassified Microcoleus TaxID=2642155 RepID=UPI002FD10B0A
MGIGGDGEFKPERFLERQFSHTSIFPLVATTGAVLAWHLLSAVTLANGSG